MAESFGFSLLFLFLLLLINAFLFRKTLQMLCWVFISFFVLLTFFYVASDWYTGNGITEATIFHMLYGAAGVPLPHLFGLAAGLIISVLLILGVAVSSGFLYRSWLPDYKFAISLFILICGIFSISAHPASPQLMHIYNDLRSEKYSHFLSEEVSKDDYKFGGGRKKSLIYIYLESYERTFFDPDVFPGLVEELLEIKKDSLDFSNIRQSPLTQWTMAGLAASQCGIPMSSVKLNRNNGSKVSKFLIPGGVCISDILSGQGYSVSYMGGADSSFSSKDVFFSNHGFHNVYGLSYFNEVSPGAPTSSWGVYDDTLLQHAAVKIEDELSSGQPFAFFILTLDTHSPNGHQTPSCRAEDRYLTGDNPMLNSVKCADRMISDFIRHLRGLIDTYGREDVVIVVSSDHLQMQSTAKDVLLKFQERRRNLFFVIDGEKVGGLVEKAGTTMDIAPTVLGLLGWDVTSLGLGRNLLSDEPTLIDKYGLGGFFKMINGWQGYLWRNSVQSRRRGVVPSL